MPDAALQVPAPTSLQPTHKLAKTFTYQYISSPARLHGLGVCRAEFFGRRHADPLQARRVDDDRAGRPQEDPRRVVPHGALRFGVLVLPLLIVAFAGSLGDE